MVRFFSHDVPEFKQKKAYAKWINTMAKTYNKIIGDLNIIFCSNDYLLEINIGFLNHDYYTDVITFDNSSLDHQIDGEIYISTDRVYEYAKENNIPINLERARVIAHGVLHLIGFNDKTNPQRLLMRMEENKWLTELNQYVPRGTSRTI